MLVTPSFSRSVKDINLAQIWRNALEELRTADLWVFGGYSLPPEDLDIKSLLIRALVGRKSPPVIRVIQRSARTKPLYDHFFGPGNYHFEEGGFEHYAFEKLHRVQQPRTGGPKSSMKKNPKVGR